MEWLYHFTRSRIDLEYLPEVMIKLVALTAWNTVAQHFVAICLLPRLPESTISQIFGDTKFLEECIHLRPDVFVVAFLVCLIVNGPGSAV